MAVFYLTIFKLYMYNIFIHPMEGGYTLIFNIMKKDISKKEHLKRLNYLIGHLNGVKKMVEGDRYCIDIIQQNLGVISALQKVNEQILKNHFDGCVSDAIKFGSKKDRERVLAELVNVFKKSKI